MRPVRYPLTLGIKISEEQRKKIERISESKQMTIGEVVRELLDSGLAARGIGI